MNEQLQKVAIMIKKTFKTQDQSDCFDGCILYNQEMCINMRADCVRGLELKFLDIKSILEDMQADIKTIKKDIGLNGNSRENR